MLNLKVTIVTHVSVAASAPMIYYEAVIPRLGMKYECLLYLKQKCSPLIGQLQFINVDTHPLETRSNIVARQ